MLNAFAELRQRIDRKEKDLLSKTDTEIEDLLADVEANMRLVKGRSSILHSVIDELEA